MSTDVTIKLQDRGIQPSAQRVAVARYVLSTERHPSADEVWTQVRKDLPQISRATVYNTLNLFVEKGLLRTFVITGGHVVFDPNTTHHHHFVDEETGSIHDVPWSAVCLQEVPRLDGYEVREVQVVFRGRRTDA